MSLIQWWAVTCDVCQFDGPVMRTERDAMNRAVAFGWSVSLGNSDYCPTCIPGDAK
jgi:hypothetical protein